MSRSERQKQIYQDIQAVETELTGCTHGSPRWFELHDRLHALLAEYTAVPQDPPPRAGSSLRSFRQASYELRGLIWLTAFGLLFALVTSFAMPFTTRDTPWMIPSLFLMLLLNIAWAVWAGRPRKE